MSHIERLEEGWVSQREPGPTAIAAGSRAVRANKGELVCSFMVQSKLGINDFKTMLARSRDGGRTWSEPTTLWPEVADRYAIFGSISRSADGRLWFYGARCAIDTPGEPFWDDATQGLKQNELIWSASKDEGRSWSPLRPIPMPTPGAAEAPGAMCVTSKGRWLAPYSPYSTFNPHVVADRTHVVVVISRDEGRSWTHRSMLRFDDPASGGAEAWVIELSDGRLLGSCWHMNTADGSDHPNAYAVSSDGGETWSPTRSTGTRGQSTALAALPDGEALLVYNGRKCDPTGVWLCRARPTAEDFGVQWDEVLWAAPAATQSGSSTSHTDWTSFAFGEPALVPAGDGAWMLVFWCAQSFGSGIRFLRFRLS